jgi:hypothetical protein
MSERIEVILNSGEWDAFNSLRPFPGEAIAFWRGVAERRKLDPKSLLSLNEKFTGLPLGHGHHWCYPLSLQCKRRPQVSPER